MKNSALLNASASGFPDQVGAGYSCLRTGNRVDHPRGVHRKADIEVSEDDESDERRPPAEVPLDVLFNR